MNYELSQRPQTVGALPDVCAPSDLILHILQEIKSEARGPVLKPKPVEKNFLKENLRKLKDIQAQSKQRLAEKQSLQPLKVLNHYSEVQPKILKPVAAPRRDCASRGGNVPKTAGAVRRPPPSPCFSSVSEGRPPHKCRSLPDLNRAGQSEKISEECEDDDLISPRSNADTERAGTARTFICSKKKTEVPSESLHRLGQIPTYLTERKKAWERERERQLRMREEALIPPGHTLLPDEERLETLDLLRKNQDELLQSLSSLPVRNDTIRLRTYKDDLERQLAKVEEGIKIFSRPKVLIKNDT